MYATTSQSWIAKETKENNACKARYEMRSFLKSRQWKGMISAGNYSQGMENYFNSYYDGLGASALKKAFNTAKALDALVW